MDSLPQGVGFFAQVDIDKVLRKETDDPCITPSHTEAIPFGKAVDIYQTLSDTNAVHREIEEWSPSLMTKLVKTPYQCSWSTI